MIRDRSWLLAVAAVAAAGCFGGGCTQEEGATPSRPGAEARGPGAGGRFSYYDEMIRVVGLSSEQTKKVALLQEQYRHETEEWQTAHAEKVKALREGMSKAYEDKDANAISQLTAEYQELRSPLHEARQKLHADVMAVLTPEQQARWEEHRVLSSVRVWFAAARLTDGQMRQVRVLYADLAKDTSQPQEDLLRKLHDRVFLDVLTPEQQEAMKKMYAAMSQPAGAATRPGEGG